MAQIKIHLIQAADCPNESYSSILNFIHSNLRTNLFVIHPTKTQTQTSLQLPTFLPRFNSFFSIADAYRAEHNIPDEEFVLLLSTTLNANSFFCALGDNDSRSGFVHISSWRATYPDLNDQAAANTYLIFSLVLRRFQYTSREYPTYMSLYNNGAFVHEVVYNTCFNNKVTDKRLIEGLLSSARICKDCFQSIKQGGMGDAMILIIENLFDKIRKKVGIYERMNPFENGEIYVYQKRIEIRLADEVVVQIPFSQNVGTSTYFVLYVYMLLTTKVMKIEWGEKSENPHIRLMRKIVSITQDGVLRQLETNFNEERFEEVKKIKAYGTFNIQSKAFENPRITKLISDMKKIVVDSFLTISSDEMWSEEIFEEYLISGDKELVLNFPMDRIKWEGCWINGLSKEFPKMRPM